MGPRVGYDVTLGENFESQRQYKDALKRKSDELTERNGIPHELSLHSLDDKAAFGVTSGD